MTEFNKILNLIKEHVKEHGRCSCEKESLLRTAEKIGISFNDLKKFERLVNRQLHEKFFKA